MILIYTKFTTYTQFHFNKPLTQCCSMPANSFSIVWWLTTNPLGRYYFLFCLHWLLIRWDYNSLAHNRNHFGFVVQLRSFSCDSMTDIQTETKQWNLVKTRKCVLQLSEKFDFYSFSLFVLPFIRCVFYKASFDWAHRTKRNWSFVFRENFN